MISGLRLRLPDGISLAPSEPEEPRTPMRVRWRGENVNYARPVWTICASCGGMGPANPILVGKGRHKVTTCGACRSRA